MFRDAITREMELRGYTLSDSPDLLMNVSARMDDKTKVTTYNDPMYGGYYGYRAGFYDPWYGYGYGTQTHVSQYTEGTVNIDMVDINQKRMVWEGVAVGRVDGDKSNDEVRAGHQCRREGNVCLLPVPRRPVSVPRDPANGAYPAASRLQVAATTALQLPISRVNLQQALGPLVGRLGLAPVPFHGGQCEQDVPVVGEVLLRLLPDTATACITQRRLS